MPNLPPTFAPNTRATRSRFSSPQQNSGTAAADGGGVNGSGNAGSRSGSAGNHTTRSNGSGGTGGAGGEGDATTAQRTMMARWLEPPIQNKSSFEEAGFQRHGVFEGMAPLGTLPKAVNVAKRLSGLHEEKLYHDAASPYSSRQNHRQQQLQKQKELREKEEEQRRQQKQMQLEQEQQLQQQQQQHALLDEPQLQQQSQEDVEDKQRRLRQKGRVVQETEPQEEEQARRQESIQQEQKPVVRSRKIILKRPSRALAEPAAAADDKSKEEDEGRPPDKAEGALKTPASDADSDGDHERNASSSTRFSGGRRRNVVIKMTQRPPVEDDSPAATAKRAERRNSHASKGNAVGAATDNIAEDDVRASESAAVAPSPATPLEHAPAEPPKQRQPKPGKRPVGRPRSRRSIAADRKALIDWVNAQAASEGEPSAVVEPELGPQVEVDAAANGASEAMADVEADAEETYFKAHDDGRRRKPVTGVRSRDEKDNGNGEVSDSGRDDDNVSDDSDTDHDYDVEHDDNSAIILDGSTSPTGAAFDFKRARSDSNATVVNKEVTDKVVELAVDEALRHFRYPTAWALRTLYDEHSSNQNFLAMVEDVFQQTADSETLATFARMLYQKKKEGKKDNKGCYYFVPPSTNSRFTPHKPKPAPYGHLVTLALPRFVGKDDADPDEHVSKKPKLVSTANEISSSSATHTTATTPTPAPANAAPLFRTFRLASSIAHPEGFVPVANKPRRKVLSIATGGSNNDKGGEASVETPAKSPRTIKTPTKVAAAPKTPTKSPSKTPGSKGKSPAGKTGSAARGKSSARKASTGATMTPSSRRRLRNRANSAASSVSSLSSVITLSPPGKGTGGGGKGKAQAQAVDGAAAEDNRVTVADGKDEGNVNAAGGEADANANKAKQPEIDVEAKPGAPAQRGKKKQAGAGADRRRGGGTGSGRGGRRKGAGRPPKIKPDAAGVNVSAKTQAPSAPKTAPAPASTPTPTPTLATALQPIATRNRSATKKAPTPLSASISPSPSSSSHNNTQTQHTTISHPKHQHHNHHPQNTRKSAAVAAAATIASTEDMPAVVEDTASVRAVPVSKRGAQVGVKSKGHGGLPAPSLNSLGARAGSAGNAESAADEQERRSRMQRESRNITNSIGVVPESYVRGSSGADGQAERASSASAGAAARSKRNAVAEAAEATEAADRQQLLQTPQSQLQRNQRQLRASTTTARATRSARKRAFDEVDDDRSPTGATFSSEEPRSARLQTPVPLQQIATANASSVNSRAGTPGPRSKKPRVGPRVKTSPIKRKTGTSAGVPRPSGERGSPVANGMANNQDDNDDYCASCGGSGELVCCDGCTRSLHFQCVDPPLQEDGGNLPDEWFCNVCLSRRNPASLVRYTGVFGSLLNIIDKKNSSAFRLPGETRDYFEGVKTGPDGEYEAIVVPNAYRTRRRGYEETPDFFRIRDADGNTILCHNCNLSAEENRAIIPCAFCGLWWHIDCLDPPLANPPVLRNWRCPAHSDDILAKLPNLLGPAHRFRKIKGASILKPAYSRGLINNGFIEFFSDDEPDDSSGWKDVGSFGRIQRVNARGVELDFLERVRKEHRKGKKRHARIDKRLERGIFSNGADAQLGAPVVSTEPPPNAFLLDRRSIDEAQAAQNLSAVKASSANVNVDRTGELIKALLSQADSNVISMMAQGSALNIESGSTLTQDDRAALEAMRARIDQLLGIGARTAPHSSISLESQEAHDFGGFTPSEAGQLPRSEQQSPKQLPELSRTADDGDIVMEDASAAEDKAELDGNTHEAENFDEGEDASKSNSGHSTHETHEAMSLVSDNGDSDLNEDEDLLPVATPLTAPHEEPASAVWSAEHHGSSNSSSSDPGNGSNGLPPSSELKLPVDVKKALSLCGHDNSKTTNGTVDDAASTQARGQDGKAHAPAGAGTKNSRSNAAKNQPKDAQDLLPPTPLTPPPATSETAVDEGDKVGEEIESRSGGDAAEAVEQHSERGDVRDSQVQDSGEASPTKSLSPPRIAATATAPSEKDARADEASSKTDPTTAA
ncbi:phd finger domain protein [Niveomyces insectorum RCEF 264]|uniref:Phd finger domain protein n=1 Tax=Niveomyces insectorum RCEF 264 TaxID=1081102 RepID=A0A167NHP2_9HYPO|nr:phd finger domain protein [Niveomyces insectorum RCEF 264]